MNGLSKTYDPIHFRNRLEKIYLMVLFSMRFEKLDFLPWNSYFDISTGLASNIITIWVKVASAILKPSIFVPDRKVMYKTLPNRVKSMPEIHSILDCTEVFIKLLKNLDLLKIRWSDYKHPNTTRLLLCAAHTIIFISPHHIYLKSLLWVHI